MMKPLLLLDVDGVLNRFGFKAEQDDCHNFMAEGYHVSVPKTAGAHLATLAEVFDIHWATAWEDRAHPAFASVLGLSKQNQWPVVRFENRPWNRTSGAGLDLQSWKLPTLRKYVGVRPFVWIDDDVPTDARKWIAERNQLIPTHVIVPPAHIGLDQSVVDRALAWGEAVREEGWAA